MNAQKALREEEKPIQNEDDKASAVPRSNTPQDGVSSHSFSSAMSLFLFSVGPEHVEDVLCLTAAVVVRARLRDEESGVLSPLMILGPLQSDAPLPIAASNH